MQHETHPRQQEDQLLQQSRHAHWSLPLAAEQLAEGGGLGCQFEG